MSSESIMSSESMELLLVEDNPADVRLTDEALRESGVPLHLSVAPDGVEALAFLRREGRYAAAPRPDLILLDLNLPRLSGREVLSTVKNDPELRQIPVIVLTTSRYEQDIRDCYALRANCYVVKSGDIDQFFSFMQSVVTFWLRLVQLPSSPVETPASTLPADDVTQPTAESPKTVLVIDDDPGITIMIREALEDEGYAVLAGLGETALSLARHHHPDAVLLDMMMPGLDGPTLSRRLRDDPRTANIPIIVMSAHAGLRAPAALLPGNDWLAKPFTVLDLYATVARWTAAG